MKEKIKSILTINWIKSIYFNFKLLPFRQAIKFPVLFSFSVRFGGLNGELIFNVPIQFNMVRFGAQIEKTKTHANKAQLTLNGKLIINGKLNVCPDYNIYIDSNGSLSIGQNTFIGSNVKISSIGAAINIGSQVQISYDSQLMSSNVHYIMDVETREIQAINGNININDYSWIANRCSIMKGSALPAKSIVTSNSLVNKNFINLPENSIIGGVPAKLISSNKVRIFNFRTEGMLNLFFEKNPNVSTYILPKHFDVF